MELHFTTANWSQKIFNECLLPLPQESEDLRIVSSWGSLRTEKCHPMFQTLLDILSKLETPVPPSNPKHRKAFLSASSHSAVQGLRMSSNINVGWIWSKCPGVRIQVWGMSFLKPRINIMAWNNHHSFSLWLCGLAVWTWWIYWSCAVSLMCLWSPGWLCPWVFADCWLSPLEQLGLLLPVTWQAALCLVTYWLSMGESRSMGARLLEA